MSYVIVQGCPVPAEMAPILERILTRSGASLQSCYRGADAEALLHKLGKHSQTELYEMFLHHVPGANPANPPGFSTHELRNDGTAYAGARGAVLLWWQVGIDVDDGHVKAFIREAAKEGFTVTITYPTSRSEYHHVNFRKAPKTIPPALKKGDQGKPVALLTRRLKTLGYLPNASWWYNDQVIAAVRKFQRDHKQKADGIVGIQTQRQIIVAIRAHKAKAAK